MKIGFINDTTQPQQQCSCGVWTHGRSGSQVICWNCYQKPKKERKAA